MTISQSVAAVIATERELLNRLERFVQTEDYRRLQAAVGPMDAGDLQGWLAGWLVKPSFGRKRLARSP